jgi:Ni/Fe-hydrogenase 1 B-type cytochrome subunit
LYYLFVRKDSAKHLGHNPLETTAMVFTFMIPLFFMILSGFALYAEGLGMNHWLYSAFGWVLVVFGGSFVVHTLHHIGMWIMAVFTCIHLYMVFREDIMGRTGILSSIVSGWRYMKDDKP